MSSQTFKQRLAEAGKLLAGHLLENRIAVRNQPAAIKTAKRNLRKYNAAARAEYVHQKAKAV